MRHKRKGRRLGRSSSHRTALMRNLTSALFLTEREDDYYDGLTQADGGVVRAPAVKGRIITTLQKAKEVRPFVEKCITIAKKALPHERAAAALECEHERNSAQWKEWREGEGWQKWVAAKAPAVAARRRVFSMIRHKEAVEILFEMIAERFEDRPGGYTRIMRLATPRLGDAGTRAILELVGVRDRKIEKSAKPAFESDEASSAKAEAPVSESEPVADDAEPAADANSDDAEN